MIDAVGKWLFDDNSGLHLFIVYLVGCAIVWIYTFRWSFSKNVNGDKGVTLETIILWLIWGLGSWIFVGYYGFMELIIRITPLVGKIDDKMKNTQIVPPDKLKEYDDEETFN